MAISALPTPPNPSLPASFEDDTTAFLGALPVFVTEANALATDVNAKATAAAASAASAQASPATAATSTTSNAIGTGAKTLTVQTGKNFSPGQRVVIADTAAPSTNAMYGAITSYNSGTGALVVAVDSIIGSGTKTAWTVSLSAGVGGAYEQGTFTPSFDFAVSGDLGVSYATRLGRYTRVGNLCYMEVHLVCTPTFTTSTGAAIFKDLPFTLPFTNGPAGSISSLSNNITWAADATLNVVPSTGSQLRIVATRPSAGTDPLTPANFTSGQAVTIAFSFLFRI